MDTPMTLGSLFDGIGGFPLAAARFGITPLWASEIVPDCIGITKRHFPQMKHLSDITEINGAEIEPVDIITFGSPCQDLSVAGKRAGLAGARSGLFGEAIRIIEEMRNNTNGKSPTWAIWENVPGALSSNDGLDFRAVLQSFTNAEIPISPNGRWAAAGMVRGGRCDCAWRIMDARFWGVPQRRRRIFLVADFGGRRAAEVLFKPHSLPGHSPQSGTPGQEFAGDAGKRFAPANDNQSALVMPINMQVATRHKKLGRSTGFGVGTDGDPAFTVQAAHSHAVAILPTITRRCGPGGNNVPAAIAANNNTEYLTGWDTQNRRVFSANGVSPTLAGSDGAGGRNPAGLLFCPGTDQAVAVHQNQCGEVRIGEVAYTLNTNGNATGRNAPLVYDCRGNGDGRVTCTLTGDHQNSVTDYTAIVCKESRYGGFSEGVGTLCARGGTCNGGGENLLCVATGQAGAEIVEDGSPTLTCAHEQPYIAGGSTVRRLTPVECERLQGFPDNWTALTHDGKEISDSARYRAIGNSVAIPCVEFIFTGITDRRIKDNE